MSALTTEQLVELIQRAVFTQPVAAQSLYRALLAEGRAYAQSEEGAELAGRLAASELVQRLRVVWDVASLRTLEDNPDTVIPTAVIDTMMRLAYSRMMERELSAVFEESRVPSE